MILIEKRIASWIEKNIYKLTIVAITIISLVIRLSLKDVVSPDSGSFLLNWYNTIKQSGGIKGLGTQVGNYNMLYQFVIAVMTYFPIKPLYAYKIISCIFDYALAILLFYTTYTATNQKCKWNACIVYGVVLLSPFVFLNSAAWAQSDAIYTFFVVASLYFVFQEKYIATFILYGIAVSFKLQAIFILPFFLLLYFCMKKFSIFHFVLVPISMIITGIPCVLAGRSVKALYTIYQKQTVHYNCVHMNYPSFWAILNSSEYTADWSSFKAMSISITVVILLLISVVVIINKVDWSAQNMLYLAFILTYTCVLFLPSMHERYGFCYEILAISIIVINKKTIPLMLSLQVLTICTYGHYLYGSPIDINLLAVINVVIYVLYCYVLWGDMVKEQNSVLSTLIK